MEQVGLVEKIDGNTATIMVKRISACGDNCANCHGACHIAGVRIKTEVPKGIVPGDYVEITTETPVMLKHILVLYGTPLVLMLVTIFTLIYILKDYQNSDIIAGLGGIASLAVSHFILKKYDAAETKNQSVKYIVAKKL